MGDRLRLAVGIMGNAASLLLYSAPILTFSRVIKKKSTIHSCPTELSPLYLVWLACGKLQMGKLPSCHHQWLRHCTRIFLHSHLYLLFNNQGEGKASALFIDLLYF
ncbi:hypothetical protein Ancab_009135 [Ancistrocladus abbreviatus]